MPETTSRRFSLWLLGLTAIAVVSIWIAVLQWQSAGASRRRAEVAERRATELGKVNDSQRDGRSNHATEERPSSSDEVNSNSDNNASSPKLEVASVVGVYQDLAQSYVAQAQMLKTAKAAGRQEKAIELLRRAASLQAITHEISEGDDAGSSASRDFWSEFVPELRKEAIGWMVQTSVQPILEETIPSSFQDSSPPQLALHSKRGLIVVMATQKEIQLRDLETAEVQATFPIQLEPRHVVVPGSLISSADGESVIYCTFPQYGNESILKLIRLDATTGKVLKSVPLVKTAFRISRPPTVRFSSDKRHLLVTMVGNTTLWDVSDGRQIRQFRSDNVEFGTSGEHLFTYNMPAEESDGAIHATSGKKVAWKDLGATEEATNRHDSTGRTGWAMTPDAKWLVRAGKPKIPSPSNGSIQLTVVEPDSGKTISQTAIEPVDSSQSSQLSAVGTVLSNSGRFAIVATTTQLVVAELPSGRVVQKTPHPQPRADAANAQRRTVGRWSSVEICQTADDRLVLLLGGRTPQNQPTSLLRIFDTVFPQEFYRDHVRNAGARSGLQLFLATDSWATCNKEGNLKVWTNANEESWSRPVVSPLIRPPTEGRVQFFGPVPRMAVSISPTLGFDRSGKLCYFASSPPVECWDVASGKLRQLITGGAIIGGDAKNGRWVVKETAPNTSDSSIRIYNAVADRDVKTFSTPQWANVQSTMLAGDGGLLIGISSATVLIGDVKTGETVTLKYDESGGIVDYLQAAFILDPSRQRLLTSTGRFGVPQSLTIHELASGKNLATWQAPPKKDGGNAEPLKGIGFSPDGNYVGFARTVERVAHAYIWKYRGDTDSESSEPIRVDREFQRIDALHLTDAGNVLVLGKTKSTDGSRPGFFGQSTMLLDQTSEVLLESNSADRSAIVALDRVLSHPESHTAVITYSGAKPSTVIWDLGKKTRGEVFPYRLGQRSPDGQLQILVDRQGAAIHILDLATGDVRMDLSGQPIRFSDDGKYFVTGDKATDAITCWSIETKEPVKLSQAVPRNSLLISLANDTLVAHDPASDSFQVWDIPNARKGKAIRVNRTNTAPEPTPAHVDSLQINATGKLLMAEVNGQLRLYSMEEDKCLVRMPRRGHRMVRAAGEGSLRGGAVCVDEQNEIVASAGGDQTVCFWNLETGAYRGMLEGFSARVTSLRFVADGRLLTLEESGRLVLWQPGEPPQDAANTLGFDALWSHSPDAAEPPPTALALSPDGEHVAFGMGQKVVERRIVNGDLMHDFDLPEESSIRQLTFLKRSKSILVAQSNGLVSEWLLGESLGEVECPRNWDTGQAPLECFAVNADEEMLATIGRRVRLWNLRDAEMLMDVELQKGQATWGEFSADGRLYLASVGGPITLVQPDEYRRALNVVGLGWKARGDTAIAERTNVAQGDETDKNAQRPSTPDRGQAEPGVAAPIDPKDVWEFHRQLATSSVTPPVFRERRDEELARKETRTLLQLARNEEADQFERDEVIEELGHRLDEPQAIVPVMVELLDSKESMVARASASVLSKFGPESRIAIPKIVEIVRALPEEISPTSDDFWVSRNLANVLAEIGLEAVPSLREQLKDENPSVRRLAMEAISVLSMYRRKLVLEFIDDLRAATSDELAEIRVSAAQTLGAMGVRGEVAVPQLEEMCREGTPPEKTAAAYALWRITADAGKVMPALDEVLQEEDAKIQLRALRLMAEIGAEAESSLDSLKQLFDGDNPELRIFAADVMAHFDTENDDLIAVCLGGLKSGAAASPGPYYAPFWRVSALAELGKRNPELIVPAMVELLEDSRTRRAAINVLGRMGPAASAAIPDLVAGAKDEDKNTRRGAIAALISMEDAGLAALCPQVTDEDLPFLARSMRARITPVEFMSPPELRTAAELKRLAAENRHAEVLVKSLHAGNHKTVGAALFGLSLIGEDAEAEIAKLADDAPVSARCAKALALGLAGSSGQAELTKMFTDEETTVRWSVVTALSQIEKPSEMARTVMNSALEDSAPSVVEAAKNALAQTAGPK